MKNLLALVFALALLPGCASSAASKVIKALGNDPATVAIRVNGWGTVIEVSRANPVLGMNSLIATDGSLNVTTLTNYVPAAPAVPVVGRFTSEPITGTFYPNSGSTVAPTPTPAPALRTTVNRPPTSPSPASRPIQRRPRPTTPATVSPDTSTPTPSPVVK